MNAHNLEFEWEHEENFDEDEDFPIVGEIRFLLWWNEEEKKMDGGQYEFTREGTWVKV